MLSKQIIRMLDQAEIISQPASQFASFEKLRHQLMTSAAHQACLRCTKAGHVLIVDANQQWRAVQVKCDDYRVLENAISPMGFGLGIDYTPETIYFCDEEAGAGAESGDADDAHQRQRGFGEFEREQSQPRRDREN